jgi:hypothetical protein
VLIPAALHPKSQRVLVSVVSTSGLVQRNILEPYNGDAGFFVSIETDTYCWKAFELVPSQPYSIRLSIVDTSGNEWPSPTELPWTARPDDAEAYERLDEPAGFGSIVEGVLSWLRAIWSSW